MARVFPARLGGKVAYGFTIIAHENRFWLSNVFWD